MSAQTSRGSLLQTIAFREQDGGRTLDRSTNDDIILGCCIQWQRQAALSSIASVMLVSNDANLRVKALAVGVPAVSSEQLQAQLRSLLFLS